MMIQEKFDKRDNLQREKVSKRKVNCVFFCPASRSSPVMLAVVRSRIDSYRVGSRAPEGWGCRCHQGAGSRNCKTPGEQAEGSRAAAAARSGCPAGTLLPGFRARITPDPPGIQSADYFRSSRDSERELLPIFRNLLHCTVDSPHIGHPLVGQVL
jgi:hypothetical protein